MAGTRLANVANAANPKEAPRETREAVGLAAGVRYTGLINEPDRRRSATMLDIKFVRDHQEAVAEAMKNRNASWDASRFSRP